ncbi:MAG TPA: hypothetical protein VGR35_23365 [Tepidisphaeraceae bacterium]|nr:hypothetical protein [Tepidisphaeraceae bacterium]
MSVRTDDNSEWRAISAKNNPLVRGSTFDLYPAEVQRQDDFTLSLRGTRRIPRAQGRSTGSIEYGYSAIVHADPRQNWFRFDVQVDSPQPIPLAMIDGFEPEIMLDLGSLPPYERGDHVWFMTTIANPTKWNDQAHGNDMPATYLYDAYLKAELMMFFDMTAMSWMSFDNIARFLNYRCGYRRRYQPQPAAALGLYADGFSGKTFPAGAQRFVYYLTAAPRAQTPSEAQAVQWLVDRCLPLLPAYSEWPERATDWRDFSRHCAQDLMSEGHCWRRDGDGEFLLNYVDAHSPAWQQAIEARGREFNMNQPCLESAVWSAHPLSVLCSIESEPLYDQLNQRLLAFIDRMVAANRTPLAPATDDAPRGSWQHLYMIEQMFQVARLRNNEPLLRQIRREMEECIIPLTRKLQYMLPLTFGKKSLVQVGAGDTYSLLGTYASLALDLHEWTGEEKYLDEAKQALRVNARLPVNSVHQEVFLLGMGVHAAARLASMASDAAEREEFIGICRYLTAQTLRMLHWFNDRTSPETRAINTLGMFLACASINYPALFENIETLARIAPALKLIGADESLLRVFDHARKNNFYFFPQCLPENYHGPLKYIPLENIGILEGPPPTTVGAEIYGAGWTFRAYLLWEAFGRCRDRDIMLLNLDAFDERRQIATGEWDLRFIAFNPTSEPRQSELVFPLAVERTATITTGAGPGSTPQPEPQTVPLTGGRSSIELEPGELRWLNVVIPG